MLHKIHFVELKYLCFFTIIIEVMASSRLRFIHIKCRNALYPRSNDLVQRFPVPDDKVNWDIKWEEYNPVDFTAPFIKNQIWADPEITDVTFKPQWNSVDGNINRQSFDGKYKIVKSYPLNIYGRTGINGRGVLGRWGPNHAADPIVTRWKRDETSKFIIDSNTNLPILQFVAIKRRDSGEWAIPGGMVDPGEVITSTLKREFLEEALNVLEKNESEKVSLSNKLNEFFSQGEEIYKGYVDDPRNTDNAWMETVAMHFHDESGSTVGSLNFCAGDDAVGVQWLDLSKTLSLYASHSGMIEKIAIKMKCSW
uniref:Nudix hydrolase domain-containing protein n=2 Tax=Homalodisca liturata TaxID=320908 RepID=A0A1B6JXX1_9HEMI